LADIENIFTLGEKRKTCPYYAVKEVAPVADVRLEKGIMKLMSLKIGDMCAVYLFDR